MIFLQPWWWLLLLLAVPLILWHARNPRAVVVPSLRIWRLIAPELAGVRSSRRTFNWRFDSSLWLQLLALLALVLALTGPRPAGRVIDHQIWLLDNTVSMAASDGERSRLDEARARVLSDVMASDAANRGGPVISLVTLSQQPRSLLARGAEPSAARAALESLHLDPGGGPVRESRLRELLRGLLDPDESSRISVLTDEPGSRAVRFALQPWLDDEGVELELTTIGEPGATHGISSLELRQLEGEERGWLVEGEIIAYPPPSGPLTLRATFQPEGADSPLPWEQVQVRFADESAPFSFKTEFPGPGRLTLELPQDALTIDNTATVLILGEPVPLRIVALGDVPAPLIEALESLPGAELMRWDPEASSPSFDLGVVGPGAEVAERPAPTVLWLAGTRQGGHQGEVLQSPREVWAGEGSLNWSGIADAQPTGPGQLFSLPPVSNSDVLLQSDRGPLLQVASSDGETDVQAAWLLGTGGWARELGFARFVAELGLVAQPHHGQLIAPRCQAGLSCTAIQGEVLAPGIYPEVDSGVVVDVAAGPEANLQLTGEEFGVEATRWLPWYRLDRLLALLAALLLTLETWRTWGRRRMARREVPGVAQWASVGLRLIGVVGLFALALGLSTPILKLHERVVLVVDHSVRSADSGVLDRLEGVAEVAEGTVWARGVGRLTESLSFDRAANPDGLEAGGYDLEAVLGLGAAALGPKGGRLIVYGAMGDAAPQSLAAPSHTSVDLVPVAPTTSTEAFISFEEIPDEVRAGEEVTIRVAVSGVAGAEATPEVTVDGERLENLAGRRNVFEWKASEPGLYLAEARLPAAEQGASTLLEVEPAGRVVLLPGDGAAPTALMERLEAQHFEVVVWEPRNVPAKAEGFLEYDVVVLLDVPALALHSARQDSLERWVREYGGGLLIAGARDAFGPGGYLRTPLEELSPLSARVPGEQPQAAIAFVLDRSGSMQQTVEGVSRLAFTKEATVEAVQLLHPESQVAIILFDDIAHLLKPLGDPADVPERLEPITAGGGTNIYPALELAFEQLQGTDAEAKHMIVMTDGLSQNAPFGMLLERITAADITVSTVAVGRGADVVLLEDIARWGSGAFHRSEDVRALPSILSQEAMLLSGNPVRQGTLQPLLDPGQVAFLEALPGNFPEVAGYVRTSPKPEADVHARTPDGDPLLATWRHGIGRVLSLSTPLVGEWGAAWDESEFADEFLGQSLRWLAAPVQHPGVTLDVLRRGDTLLTTARVLDGEGVPVTGARLIARGEDPRGMPLGPVLLSEVGRGVYAGSIDAFSPGRYELTVGVQDNQELQSAESFHVSIPASEGRGTGRVAVVSQLVRDSGGQIILESEGSLLPLQPRVTFEPILGIWAWLTVAAWASALVLDGLGLHNTSRSATRRESKFRMLRRGAG